MLILKSIPVFWKSIPVITGIRCAAGNPAFASDQRGVYFCAAYFSFQNLTKEVFGMVHSK